MAAKGKMAIARMTRGTVGVPRLVALLPQPRIEEASGVSPLPCGFHLITLPFADDVRSIKKPPALPEDAFTEPQLTAAHDLVDSLRLPEGQRPIGTVANPALVTHYNYVQVCPTDRPAFSPPLISSQLLSPSPPPLTSSSLTSPSPSLPQVLALNVPGDEVPTMVDGTHPDYAWLADRQPQVFTSYLLPLTSHLLLLTFHLLPFRTSYFFLPTFRWTPSARHSSSQTPRAQTRSLTQPRRPKLAAALRAEEG